MSITIQDPRNKFVGGTIEFIYDASGAKLRKIVTPSALNGGSVTTYDYINGVEYKNGTLDRINHTEGAVVRNENGVYQHEYVLRDHLGNTRVTFRDGVNQGDPYEDWLGNYINPNAGNGYNDGVVTTADIKQINNFYPFGLNMEGNWNGAAGSNKYGYNGKEWNDDFGLGWNDYGARFYDASIARFYVMDRFSEKYMAINPYQYGGDNPIKYIDINGDSIGIASSITNNGNLNKAFEIFAQSKQGKNFLSQYAQKGQVVGGVTFNKDGKYHSKGLNLNYKAENMTDRGYTTLYAKNKSITVAINPNFSSTDKDTYWKETIGKTLTFFHESFIHANLFTGDFIDDGQKNYSNVSQSAKDAAGGYSAHFHHYQVGMEQNNGSSNLWPQQAFNAMKDINKAYSSPNLYKNDSQLWNAMWNYEGGGGFEKY